MAQNSDFWAEKRAKNEVCCYQSVNRYKLQQVEIKEVADYGRAEKWPPQGRGGGGKAGNRDQGTGNREQEKLAALVVVHEWIVR